MDPNAAPKPQDNPQPPATSTPPSPSLGSQPPAPQSPAATTPETHAPTPTPLPPASGAPASRRNLMFIAGGIVALLILATVLMAKL